jgi:hypothetical protein
MKDVATRTVVILGRRPSVRWNDVRKGLHKGQELVVLSLGYPVTAAQRQALLRADEVAAETGAWFDARLVTSMSDMVTALEPEDEVIVGVRGRMGRSLRGFVPGRITSSD